MPRPKKTPDTAAMLEAARLYYEKELPKQKIAQRLGIDAREVTWLLNEARRLRLVRIDILAMAEGELEQKLRGKFPHLEKTLIVSGPPITTADQYSRMLRKWALVAADYFNELVDHHARSKPLHVGISGGETLLEFVNAVPERVRPNVYIHTTALVGHGRLHKAANHILPIVNASVLWSRCGRLPGNHVEYATVPPYDVAKPGAEARAAVEAELDKLAANRPIREVIEAMNGLDVAFAGIGMVNPKATPALRNRISMTGLLHSIVTPDQLEAEGAIADFSYNLIDGEGRSKEKWRFFLTAGHYTDHPGLAFFQRMVATGRKVVAIAGAHKIPAIKAALAAKAFNVWITDQHSAEALATAR